MSGLMLSGTVRANETLLLGPDMLGNFTPVAIKSIHRKRHVVQQVPRPCCLLTYGDAARLTGCARPGKLFADGHLRAQEDKTLRHPQGPALPPPLRHFLTLLTGTCACASGGCRAW